MKEDFIPTSEIASSLGVKPATVIRSLCVNGHYMGLRPRKLPNNRLLWPKDGLDRLLSDGSDEARSE